ncbi:hypothetical protein PR003_g22498 [Phytophthora rubi]|uniref:BED-type domain-containing protein n=1 Tax=Phytophthora rubi TaxID=129364 RepID=A0A6A4DFH0_9STRA|nr:hypothetical protein PR003_g22498 [Phytophthora rubi]
MSNPADATEDEDMAESSDNRSPDDRPTTVRRSPRLAAQRASSSPTVRVRNPRVGATRRPGRPTNPIWRYFDKVTDKSSKPHASCKYCLAVIRSAQPGKNMQRHLKDCPNAPTAIKQRIHEMFPDGRRQVAAPTLPAGGSSTGVGAGNFDGGNTHHTPPLLTAQQQQQFEMALASMFFLCALPFVLVESEVFRKPFQLLAPGIRFPSRHRLSGVLLQRARDEIRERALKLIRLRKVVTIVTDSWTNVNHSTIKNFMVVAPGLRSVFWSSLATDTASETAEYLADHLGRVINEVERETNATVAGVLADNVSNMDAAWKLLERSRPIFGGGCAAHMLNLLIQDVCKLELFKSVQTKALAITAYVRDHHALRSQFTITLREATSDHRRVLTVPVLTRWYSLHACFVRVLDNKNVLKKLFTEPQFADLIKNSASSKTSKDKLGQVKIYIRDASFWRKLEQEVAFLDPVIEALRELESDNCPTSRVYSRFQWLLNHPIFGTDDEQSDVQAAIKALVEDRWKHEHTDVTGLAFLLDPHTDPDDFVGTDEKDTYRQGDNDGVEPITWWWNNKKHHPLLWELAKRVFATPSSSAASDRAWSIVDFIHSKKRNRLTTDKVDMLAFIYVNHNAVSSDPTNWARLHSYPECPEARERESHSLRDVTEQ